jgi:tryptophan synthase
MGTTGSSANVEINMSLPDIIAGVRAFTSVPLAVGFGVYTREHFDTVANSGADGVVIGSRLVGIIKSSEKGKHVENIRNYCLEMSRDRPAKEAVAAPPLVSPPLPVPPSNLASLAASHPHLDSAVPVPNSTPITSPSNPVLPARFGQFGGQYVPEALVDGLVELELAHKNAVADPEFWKEFESYYGYMNRPSKLYLAERLTEHAGGAKIWFKREDL